MFDWIIEGTKQFEILSSIMGLLVGSNSIFLFFTTNAVAKYTRPMSVSIVVVNSLLALIGALLLYSVGVGSRVMRKDSAQWIAIAWFLRGVIQASVYWGKNYSWVNFNLFTLCFSIVSVIAYWHNSMILREHKKVNEAIDKL
jgi:hypothetical protein